MAQHDYVIDNSTGANVRADINNVLLAISSNNSGSSAPSTNYASQFFANTSTSIMQLRNTSNNAHVNVFTLAGGPAFAVDGIIIPKDKAVGLTPTVVKVSVGAAATVPVVAVTNLSRALRTLKESGFWVYGTSERGEQCITAADVSVPTAWVMGNEMKGISANVEKHCDALYRISTSGFSTLNIATSASICLYQTFNMRHATKR